MKDLIIIGAGPAGVTSAIYAKRSGLDFDIYEKSCIGGNVVNAFENCFDEIISTIKQLDLIKYDD